MRIKYCRPKSLSFTAEHIFWKKLLNSMLRLLSDTTITRLTRIRSDTLPKNILAAQILTTLNCNFQNRPKIFVSLQFSKALSHLPVFHTNKDVVSSVSIRGDISNMKIFE